MKPAGDKPNEHPYYAYCHLRGPEMLASRLAWIGGGAFGPYGGLFDGVFIDDGEVVALPLDGSWLWRKVPYAKAVAESGIDLPKDGYSESGPVRGILEVECTRNPVARGLGALAHEHQLPVGVSLRTILTTPLVAKGETYLGDYARSFWGVAREVAGKPRYRYGKEWTLVETGPRDVVEVLRENVCWYVDGDERAWRESGWKAVEDLVIPAVEKARAEVIDSWKGEPVLF